MPDLGKELLRLLASVDRESPSIDRPGAEAALRTHLRELSIPIRPIEWVRDPLALLERAEEGFDSHWLDRWATWKRKAYFFDLEPGRFPRFEALHRFLVESGEQAATLAVFWHLRRRAAAAIRADLFDAGLPGAATRASSWVTLSSPYVRRAWLPLLGAYQAGAWIYWVLRDRILVVPQPVLRTAQGRLHSARGPALEWGSPRSLRMWWWHGMKVPRHVVDAPESISLDEVEEEPNMELRRVLLERFGKERFLAESGAREVQRDAWGVLYRADAGLNPVAMVQVTNSTPEPDGSRKAYFLLVPPTVRTAREAVAWTFGLRSEEYSPVSES